MNVEQWMETISEAYQSVGKSLDKRKKELLLAGIDSKDYESEEQIKAMFEMRNVMVDFIYKKATRGETFGPIQKIKDYYGRTLEENYGLTNGPFINMAKTYWTFQIEYLELTQSFKDESEFVSIAVVLARIEEDWASVFFPMPGPTKVPMKMRKEEQRKILLAYAPDIDVERFLSENPILKVDVESEKSGEWVKMSKKERREILQETDPDIDATNVDVERLLPENSILKFDEATQKSKKPKYDISMIQMYLAHCGVGLFFQ